MNINSRLQSSQRCIREGSECPDAINALPACLWQLQPTFEFSIIGQQEKPFGVHIQTTDCVDMTNVRGQVLEHGVTTALIIMRCHAPARFVVTPELSPGRVG